MRDFKGWVLGVAALGADRETPQDDRSRMIALSKRVLGEVIEDPAAYVARLEGWSQEPPPASVLGVLGGVGAPLGELQATALGLRAAWQGARRGVMFTHHERRGRLAMPEELEPEIAVWAEGGTVPTWVDGVLSEPKYFSFFQDAPLPSFNPNHRGKWRSHELLHGAQGFYWNPGMTRFEFALGARLNELLPVVHWWGLDEAFRPRCAAHAGSGPPPRRTCRSCEALEGLPHAAQLPAFFEVYREAAVAHVARAVAHYDAEWQACCEELASGRRVVTRWEGLDASSDAMGYLQGHWGRVTAWSFGTWVELFLVNGEDYELNLHRYAARCAATARELVQLEPMEVDTEEVARRRGRRLLQDLGYRALLALEHLPESLNTDAVMDALEAAAEAAGALLDPGVDPGEALAEHVPAIERALRPHQRRLPEEIQAAWPARAWTAPGARALLGEASPPSAELKQVAEGLRSALPQAMAEVEDALLARWAEGFVRSPIFEGAGTLGQRFGRWLTAEAASPRDEALEAEASFVRFEAWLQGLDPQDEDAELLASLPPDDEALRAPTSRLQLNATCSRAHLDPATVERALGEASSPGGEPVLAVRFHGEPRVIVITPSIAAVLEALHDPEAPVASWLEDDLLEVIHELLEVGVLLWEPRPDWNIAG